MKSWHSPKLRLADGEGDSLGDGVSLAEGGLGGTQRQSTWNLVPGAWSK